MDPHDVFSILNQVCLGDRVRITSIRHGLMSDREEMNVGFLVEASFMRLGLSETSPSVVRISEAAGDVVFGPYQVKRYDLSDILTYNVIERRDGVTKRR